MYEEFSMTVVLCAACIGAILWTGLARTVGL
jgi:hypothetical protein